MNYRKLWGILSLVIIISFAIIGYYGGRIYQVMPPIPDRVVTQDETVVLTGEDRPLISNFQIRLISGLVIKAMNM